MGRDNQDTPANRQPRNSQPRKPYKVRCRRLSPTRGTQNTLKAQHCGRYTIAFGQTFLLGIIHTTPRNSSSRTVQSAECVMAFYAELKLSSVQYLPFGELCPFLIYHWRGEGFATYGHVISASVAASLRARLGVATINSAIGYHKASGASRAFTPSRCRRR